MKIDIDIISKNPLFDKINKNDINSIFSCLNVRTGEYKKGSYVFFEGESIDCIGIVQKGTLAAVKDTIGGNRSIFEQFSSPEMFGGAFACAQIKHSPISIQALQDSEVVLLNYKRIITTCSNACIFHNMLIENMMKILADKVLSLNGKLNVLSNRTTRDKLISYLEMQKDIANSNKFTIPHNREQLADFLFVDRSAMSRELCKMRDEGLINFYKNNFELLY